MRTQLAPFSFRLLLTGFALLAFASAAPGADDGSAASGPQCHKGKLLISEDFAGDALDKEWKPLKGKWEVTDGVLKGVEKPEDNHAAVVRHALKARDVIGEFSFRFDGGKMVAFSLNNQKGHVCRVTITPTLVSLHKDKPNKDSDEKPAVLAREKVDLQPGQWHTMVVTVCGKQMAASLDGKPILAGTNDGIDVDKTALAFPTTGEGVSLKKIRVWKAVPGKGAEAEGAGTGEGEK